MGSLLTTLRPGITGAAPFSPIDIPGLTLWLDASDTSTITESGGAVSQWDDKSGNGYDVTQGTAALQPTTGVTTLNSLNILDFASDRMASTAGGFDGDHTIITVTTNATTGPSHILSWGLQSTNNRRAHFIWDGGSAPTTLWYSGFGAASNWDTTVVPTTNIFVSTVSGQTLNTFVDGVSTGGKTLALNSISPSPFYVGESPNGTETLTGSIAEILVFNAALSTSDRQEVEQYLSSKWGITI